MMDQQKMKFKISSKTISKRKRIPAIILAFFILVIVLLMIPDYSEDFELDILIMILSLSAIISAGASYGGYRSFLKGAQEHYLEVNQEGLCFHGSEAETLIRWDRITDMDIKRNKRSIKKITLKSTSVKIDLSDYEMPDKLEAILAQFIKPNS